MGARSRLCGSATDQTAPASRLTRMMRSIVKRVWERSCMGTVPYHSLTSDHPPGHRSGRRAISNRKLAIDQDMNHPSDSWWGSS